MSHILKFHLTKENKCSIIVIKEFQVRRKEYFMTDEEKRKFEIIKSIIEDLKEISKPPNPEKTSRELNAPLTSVEIRYTF